MTIKNILVHLSSQGQNTRKIRHAIDIACQHDAQITFVYVILPDLMPDQTAQESLQTFWYDLKEKAKEKEEKLKIDVEKKCAEKSIHWDWYCEEKNELESLNTHSYYTDLVIVKQMNTLALEERLITHLSDNLPFTTGLPILTLPHRKHFDHIGKKILIAWKPCREATRAIHDTLTILQKSEKVYLLFSEKKREKDIKELDQIYNHLKRHHINVEILTESDEDKKEKTGAYIIRKAEENQCDLIVMGAYGHARLMEMVFGGTTRYMLQNMTIPIIMSH